MSKTDIKPTEFYEGSEDDYTYDLKKFKIACQYTEIVAENEEQALRLANVHRDIKLKINKEKPSQDFKVIEVEDEVSIGEVEDFNSSTGAGY